MLMEMNMNMKMKMWCVVFWVGRGSKKRRGEEGSLVNWVDSLQKLFLNSA
jgi:hypothetical protein